MSDSLLDNLAHLSNQERTTGKEPYKAFGGDQSKDRQINLEIREKNGNGYLIPYGQVTLIKYTSHQFISLFCASYICNIEGGNLGSLIQFLQDSRVRYIQEFNKNRFMETGKDEPIIERISLEEIGKENRFLN